MTTTKERNKGHSFKPRFRPIINSYLFILIPFFILLFVKIQQQGFIGGLAAMFSISDWSLISFVMFAQSMCNFLSMISNTEVRAKDPDFIGTRFVQYIFFGIVPSSACIWIINTDISPPLWVAILQFAVFIFASYRYIVDGLTIQRINHFNQQGE
ncbi:hypothetical protein [Photobacterium phosphoreum]|uniref:hypothetical protein n=1 Tax=Photobacterium phosphoreum TaxID=659 RepID=UPI0039AF9FC0